MTRTGKGVYLRKYLGKTIKNIPAQIHFCWVYPNTVRLGHITALSNMKFPRKSNFYSSCILSLGCMDIMSIIIYNIIKKVCSSCKRNN